MKISTATRGRASVNDPVPETERTTRAIIGKVNKKIRGESGVSLFRGWRSLRIRSRASGAALCCVVGTSLSRCVDVSAGHDIKPDPGVLHDLGVGSFHPWNTV